MKTSNGKVFPHIEVGQPHASAAKTSFDSSAPRLVSRIKPSSISINPASTQAIQIRIVPISQIGTEPRPVVFQIQTAHQTQAKEYRFGTRILFVQIGALDDWRPLVLDQLNVLRDVAFIGPAPPPAIV